MCHRILLGFSNCSWVNSDVKSSRGERETILIESENRLRSACTFYLNAKVMSCGIQTDHLALGCFVPLRFTL